MMACPAAVTPLLRRIAGRLGLALLMGMLGWLVGGPLAVAATPDPSAIVGDWLVESRDAIIRIERNGDQYEGRIVWQLHDTYGPEDGPALNGKPVTDRKNPDPSLRSRPLTGLRLLWGLQFDPASGGWLNGSIYNSDNGKTYQCQVRLIDANTLRLRGYIGISLLGGNTRWTRVREKTPDIKEPGKPNH